MTDNQNNPPYQSALDIPSIAKMADELQTAGRLTRVFGRKHRAEILKIEAQLHRLVGIVDRFYALLGPRHWIFHDRLNVEQIADLLDLPVDEAERRLIELYMEPESLRFAILGLNHFPAMRLRMHLLERAEKDYHEKRYYSTVLVLLAVMDGFVNDFENQHRGLHTRSEEEMSAWDSVVGHHLGLTNAHRTFTKSTSKTSDEEVFDLYRNGIVHGTIVNFDNDVVATKAWNRLFAVCDWATSEERRRVEPEAEPTWRELFAQMAENQKARKALDEWKPSVLEAGAPGLESNEVFVRANEYLSLWKRGNYGRMAPFLSKLVAEDSDKATAGMIRTEYSTFPLTAFTITAVRHDVPAICEVEAELEFGPERKSARMQWNREGDDWVPVSPNQPGEWRLVRWGPLAMMQPEPAGEDETS